MKKMLTFCLLGLLVACGKPEPEIHVFTGVAQGTTYSVKYWHAQGQVIQQAVIDAELARIDELISNYRDDSAIEAFNQNKVADIPILLDKEILSLLAIAQEVHTKSNGCYDPTIGSLFGIWGFKKDSLRIPDEATITKTLENIGFSDKLAIDTQAVTKKHPETTIDLSAIGQGYAVAQISRLLEAHGITNYITEIGGEMLVSGAKPNQQQWRVGVERPVPNSQTVNEVITVTGKQAVAIMTSGTYRHYFDDNGVQYSHILDPRTGKPITHQSVSATVLLPDATYADAWSTALLCLGSEVGLAVANTHNIPVVFYDLAGDKLIRKENTAVPVNSALWKIEKVQ